MTATAPTLREHVAMLARYSLWATQRLFTHIDALPEADYRRDAGLFFRSVHGTLNHLLVAEQVWFARFAQGESPQIPLDAELESDRACLRNALLERVSAWPGFVLACPEARWPGDLHYRRVNGQPMVLPFAAVIAHVFNHGTHHRGQISAAITALGQACPEIDLVWMLVEESTKAPV